MKKLKVYWTVVWREKGCRRWSLTDDWVTSSEALAKKEAYHLTKTDMCEAVYRAAKVEVEE
jgi:hypothetical protein